MRIKDIHPNTIYRYVGNSQRTAFYFRTGDFVVAQPSPRSHSDKAPSNHLLVQTDTSCYDEDNVWTPNYVDHVEVLRWVDNERGSDVVNGDQTLDLTFQPQPFQQSRQHLLTYRNPFSGERWLDGERDALIAEWGTEYYWDTSDRPSLCSLGAHLGTVPLAGIEGPYDEAEMAAERLIKRAERAEANARHAERSAAREALRTEATAFLVTTLAGVPEALVGNTSNGFPRAVEQAQSKGTSDWSLDGGYPADDIDTETPDGGTLVGLKASTLAAITYAWQQVYGDASWEDIGAGVYERFHESDEVKHLGIKVPATEDVEAVAKRVAQYLPANYEVVGTESYRNSSEVLVKGTDVAGWTADGYVIPRLATGLLTATVYSLSRKAVSA